MSSVSRLVLFGSILALTACRGVLGIEQDPLPEPRATEQPTVPSESSDQTTRFCSTTDPHPDFCSDFDEGEVGDGFYNARKKPDPGEHGGGTIRADDALFASGPRSVRFALPALVSDTSMAGAFLLHELTEPPQSTTFTLDLRIDTESIPEGKGRVTLFNLNFGADVGAISLYRDASGTNLEVYEKGAPTKTAKLSQPIPIGQWRTISILVHNYKIVNEVSAPNDGEVMIVVGGPVAKLPLPSTFRRSEMLPRLELGAFVARGPMEELRLNIDNVRIMYGLPPPDP